MLGDSMVADTERPIVDGFLLSASQVYLPLSYRAHALAQMDILRHAAGYRPRWFNVPSDSQQLIPAYSQLEYQIAVQPGSYVWGLSFFERGGTSTIKLQITDTCTETPFFSDYVNGVTLQEQRLTPLSFDFSVHTPVLINPRLIGQPGQLNVELYNSSNEDKYCQLVIFSAEPQVPNDDMLYALKQAGVVV